MKCRFCGCKCVHTYPDTSRGPPVGFIEAGDPSACKRSHILELNALGRLMGTGCWPRKAVERFMARAEHIMELLEDDSAPVDG